MLVLYTAVAQQYKQTLDDTMYYVLDNSGNIILLLIQAARVMKTTKQTAQIMAKCRQNIDRQIDQLINCNSKNHFWLTICVIINNENNKNCDAPFIYHVI